MLLFAAAKWGTDEMDPDLFDCRLRPWYLQAAASPKDLFILVDVSGSMTGVRKEIARHVVLTLLDTLSENDFVNIYLFSDVPEVSVPCFKDKMVQVRRLIWQLNDSKTSYPLLTRRNSEVTGSQQQVHWGKLAAC